MVYIINMQSRVNKIDNWIENYAIPKTISWTNYVHFEGQNKATLQYPIAIYNLFKYDNIVVPIYF